MTKYYIDGSYDDNGKIVVKDIKTDEVIVKVKDVETLTNWLEMNEEK